MRSRTILVLCCVVLGLAGCGYYSWQKPGASKDDFKADQNACSQSGSAAAAFNACMKERGWSYLD